MPRAQIEYILFVREARMASDIAQVMPDFVLKLPVRISFQEL